MTTGGPRLTNGGISRGQGSGCTWARTSASRLQSQLLSLGLFRERDITGKGDLLAFFQPRQTSRHSARHIRLLTTTATSCSSGDLRHDSSTTGGRWTFGKEKSSIRLDSQSLSVPNGGKGRVRGKESGKK